MWYKRVLSRVKAIRAVAWLAPVVAIAAFLRPWGTGSAIGSGPPIAFERPAMAALLLAILAASITTWVSRSQGARSLTHRAIAIAAGLCVLAVALNLRRSAEAAGHEHILAGAGWSFLAASGALSLAAALGCASLKPLVSKKTRKPTRAKNKR